MRGMRFVPWRVPPTSWSTDFGVATAAFVLLLWPALLRLGPVGVLAAATVAVTLGALVNRARQRSLGGAPDLRSCQVCGTDTLSSTALCPEHRAQADVA